jgi:hypothetical protein
MSSQAIHSCFPCKSEVAISDNLHLIPQKQKANAEGNWQRMVQHVLDYKYLRIVNNFKIIIDRQEYLVYHRQAAEEQKTIRCPIPGLKCS